MQVPDPQGRHSPLPRNSQEALAQVCDAVQRNSVGAGLFDEVRVTMRAYCELSRQDGTKPEHLLVDLKRGLYDARSIPASLPHDREDALNRVVKCAIETYFEVPAQ